MEIYERNINSTVRKIDENTIRTEAALLDLNHSMRVALTIRLDTKEIIDAEASILKAPLGICATTTELAKRLIGLKVARGINGQLVQVLGGCDGCTHIYELALNAVRLSFNVMVGMKFSWSEWVSRTLPEPEFTEKAMPYLKNACRPFRETKE